jgi:hypothetical protein
VDVAFDAWRSWCDKQGREHPGIVASFGRDLRSALPTLKVVQSQDYGGARFRIYEGFSLKR